VPDNCRTAVDHNKSWKDQRINAVYKVHIPQELRIRSRGTERHSASN